MTLALLRAEWTKMRTEAGLGWLLLATVVSTVSATALLLSSTGCCVTDPTRLSLTGVLLSQSVVVVLATVGVGSEYSSGMIRTTLTAMPNRSCVLAAKATVLTAVIVATGTVAVLGLLGAGALILNAKGLPTLSLVDGATVRAATGSVLCLALVGLLGLGLATAFRNAATAVGVALAAIYVLPIVVRAVADPDWQRRLDQISPLTAELSIQSARNLATQPTGPWQALGIVAAWAAASLLTGWLLFHRRDA